MKKYFLLISLGIALTLVISGCSESGKSNGSWITDFKKGLELSASTGKPVFAYFHQEGCVWCEKLEKDVLSDPNVLNTLSENYVLVKIDINKDRNTAIRYGIRGTPTLLLIDDNGDVMTMIDHSWFYNGENFEKDKFLSIMDHITGFIKQS